MANQRFVGPQLAFLPVAVSVWQPRIQGKWCSLRSLIVKRSQSYTPYGAIGGDGYCSVLKYNGDHLDDLVSGYHLGVGKRLYLPALMRFASPDALSPFLKGGINSYSYCAGDPVNYSDPTGQSPGSPKLVRKLSQTAPSKPSSSSSSNVPVKNPKQQNITFKLEGPELRDKYLIMRNKKIPPQDIIQSNPDLRPFVERNSKLAVLARLRGSPSSDRNILPEDLDVLNYIKRVVAPPVGGSDVDDYLFDTYASNIASGGDRIPELMKVTAWIRAEREMFG